MKRIILVLALSASIALNANSQSTNTRDLHLYITGGMKFLQPKYFGHAYNISPAAVPTIGGGALWQVKKFLVGGEFNYTDGKKNTPEFGTIFTGINFNCVGGYNWSLRERLRLNIQSGFGYSLYHLSLTDKTYSASANLNTAIYHNFIYTVPVSVMLQRINANGTFAGLRAGYNFNAMPNTWRYIEGSSTEEFSSGADGFYIQIILGGLLNLKQLRP